VIRPRPQQHRRTLRDSRRIYCPETAFGAARGPKCETLLAHVDYFLIAEIHPERQGPQKVVEEQIPEVIRKYTSYRAACARRLDRRLRFRPGFWWSVGLTSTA